MSTWTDITFGGQGHSVTLVQVTHSHYSRSFFYLQTAGSIEAKWYVQPPWNQRKNEEIVLAAWLIRSAYWKKKRLKSSSLIPKGRWSWKLVCSIVRSWLPSLFKGWPWVGRDLLTAMSKFVPCAIVLKMEKQKHCCLLHRSWWLAFALILMSTWIYMNMKGQGHSFALIQGYSVNMFRCIFLRIRLPDWSQILHEDSMRRRKPLLTKLKGANSKTYIYIYQKLWFLYSSSSLIMLIIYMKFHEDILNYFKVIGWTQFGTETIIYKVHKCCNTNNIHTRVMVLALHTLTNVG